MSRLSVLVLLFVSLAEPSVAWASDDPEPGALVVEAASPAGTWQGDVQVPGMQMRIIVHIERADGALSGTISIPVQSVSRLPLDRVSFEGGVLRFSIAAAGANWELSLDEAGNIAEGVLKQAGMEFPTKVERLAEGQDADSGLKRPQTPVPPFPYETRDIEFASEADGVRLAGTICIPEGNGPHPAVVFITGSGPQDRDETIFDHKPFLVLADDLARHGVASLRYDDRGVGGSQGDLSLATIETFVGDVRGAMAVLAETPEIDRARIGLIGHSEGGIVAPAVAADNEDVAFIVLLAGTGVPGEEVLRVQLRAILEASGVSAPDMARQLATQSRTLELVRDPGRSEELRTLIRATVAEQMAGQSEAMIDEMAAAHFASVNSPWFRSFMTHDPRPSLRRVRCPVLALDGSKDLQVLPSQNLPPIREALEEAGNGDVTIRELPGMNHMFQEADTGVMTEYAQIETTMDPRVIEMIRAWVRERAGLAD